MKLSRIEQETIILYNEAEATAGVFTYDSKLLGKLERLAEKYPEQIGVPANRNISFRKPAFWYGSLTVRTPGGCQKKGESKWGDSAKAEECISKGMISISCSGLNISICSAFRIQVKEEVV